MVVAPSVSMADADPSPTSSLPTTIAMWSTHLDEGPASLEDWLVRVDERLGDAAAAGADLVVMPELASMTWLSYGPKLPLSAQCGWMAEQAARALPALRERVLDHGMALMPGTTPFRRRDGALVNRAFFLDADGEVHHHDKLALTPSENHPDGWCLEPGDALHVFGWRGLRVAILICLDVQLTRAAVRLAEHEVDLLLVPAGTRDLASHHRVFDCAKARAVELQCAVATVGVLGHIGREAYVGGAALFLPCEHTVGETGVAVSTGPVSADSRRAPFLMARDVPFETCRRIRRGGAEASPKPAAWVDHDVRDSIH